MDADGTEIDVDVGSYGCGQLQMWAVTDVGSYGCGRGAVTDVDVGSYGCECRQLRTWTWTCECLKLG